MEKNKEAQMVNKQDTITEKAETNQMFKNHNPNSNHNTKKESCGPNTKR